MCGFVGIANIHSVNPKSWLLRGSDAMISRGPDAAGEWWSEDGCVGLAHRRLAIFDLTKSGHQPMHLANSSLSIVFNGEIYNFKVLRKKLIKRGYNFFSNSDTEVLLTAYAEWGEDCLSRINGMFAFAIYDAKNNKLFLARDRAGEKPLFYHHTNAGFRFGSELKGLMADKTIERRIDPGALDCYLSMGYVPGDRCILKGFKKLPPAHALRFDLNNGQARVWRYWQVPELEVKSIKNVIDETLLLADLENLLESSVRQQMVADVPVGVLLSGGVDSSLLTAMAVRATSKVKTFCISFPGHGRFDETEHARLIAKHFDTEHIELEAQASSADLLPVLAGHFDEPIVDSSMIPTFLLSQLVREHCTVALGGDGGDELFGGYSHYSRVLWMQQYFGSIPCAVRQGISVIAEKFLPIGTKGRNYLQGLGVDLDTSLPLIASYFDVETRRKLLSFQGGVAESVLRRSTPLKSDLLQRMTRMDFTNYLAEDILVKVDRASMANSLEVRAPFLDHRLIEFAFREVPSYLKATGQNRKILLKRLAKNLLPPEFDLKRKQGFSIPLADWLNKGSYREMFYDVLLDSQCVFDSGTIENLFRGQSKGRNNSERLFSLVMFELWRRRYGVVL